MSIQVVEGTLPRLDVETQQATAQVYAYGAHVARWQPAHAAAPVLFLSRNSTFEPGRPIRGGVPICFPWFGPHPADKNAPAHGIARTASWTLLDPSESADGSVSLVFALRGDPATYPWWPHTFAITHRITIGTRLTMTLTVENRGSDAFSFEEALHSYFAVRSIDTVAVEGLENTVYLDKVEAFARRTQGNDAIRFGGETDRVYLDTMAACVIHDPGNRRRIHVRKSGSRTTVVWNPWVEKARAMPDFGDDEWREMVCVETANVGEAAVRLEPGDASVMSAQISVEAL